MDTTIQTLIKLLIIPSFAACGAVILTVALCMSLDMNGVKDKRMLIEAHAFLFGLVAFSGCLCLQLIKLIK